MLGGEPARLMKFSTHPTRDRVSGTANICAKQSTTAFANGTRLSNRIPAGRLIYLGSIQGVLTFFCSDESNYLNASVVTVDGMWTRK